MVIRAGRRECGGQGDLADGSCVVARILGVRRQRMIAARLALAVLLLQGAVLLTWYVTPGEPPRGQTLTMWQLLWASSRKATFYPLVALLVAGPVLTVLACRVDGRHRLWLVCGWVGFALVATHAFSHRLEVMLRVLWWQFWR
jgi:hypothetical protein